MSMFEGTKEAAQMARFVVHHQKLNYRVERLRAEARRVEPEWMVIYDDEHAGFEDRSAVYFILSPRMKRVKIGVAKDRWQRFSDIQSHSADMLDMIGYLLGGSFKTEAALHRLFAKEHDHGEWFHYTQRIMDFVFAFCKDGDEDF